MESRRANRRGQFEEGRSELSLRVQGWNCGMVTFHPGLVIVTPDKDVQSPVAGSCLSSSPCLLLPRVTT